jgi:hypothetical protein
MLDPDIIRQHIIPQYRRIIDLVHFSDKKFLLHSCGKIFPVMDDIIEMGIDAKHSNEDQIAPFMLWIGANIKPPSFDNISQRVRTSFRTSSGEDRLITVAVSTPPPPEGYISSKFFLKHNRVHLVAVCLDRINNIKTHFNQIRNKLFNTAT